MTGNEFCTYYCTVLFLIISLTLSLIYPTIRFTNSFGGEGLNFGEPTVLASLFVSEAIITNDLFSLESKGQKKITEYERVNSKDVRTLITCDDEIQ